MSPTIWARLDDRLIHGQVVVGWRQHLRFEAIHVVDDEVARDPFLRDVLRAAAPAGVAVEVYAAKEAADALAASSSRMVLLLVKRPQTALALLEAGVPLVQLNVGNLAPAPGSTRAVRAISLTPSHAAALDELAERGVRVTLQPTLDDPAIEWGAVRGKYGA
jgi:mannose/fructose/N-acetylgalactosamine-specific phosphotransferase system component IIB